MVTFEDPEQAETRAQEPDENGHYTCPVCQDYTGEQGSVEAHITGKSDEAHKGRVGKDYRVEDVDGNLHVAEDYVPPKIGTERFEEKMIPDDDPELEDDTSDDDDDGLGAVLVAGLIVLVLWLASQTGNENQVRDRLGQP
jgi:hypothetical protein